MNYMYLMKKISEEVNVENEETLAIKKAVLNSKLDFDNEEYKEQIKKYSEGKAKDLYC